MSACLYITLACYSSLCNDCRRVNEESDDEALLTRVQRAFKSIDTDECGFIMEDRLPEVGPDCDLDYDYDHDYQHDLACV